MTPHSISKGIPPDRRTAQARAQNNCVERTRRTAPLTHDVGLHSRTGLMAIDRTSDAWLFMKRRSGAEFSRPRFMDFYRTMVNEEASTDPDFPVRLRRLALQVVGSDDPVWLRKALHALAFVGEKSDVEIIQRLTEHADENVAGDAKTSLAEFHRRHGRA